MVGPAHEAWAAASEQQRQSARQRLGEATAQLATASLADVRSRLRQCTELRDQIAFCAAELSEFRSKQRQLESRGLGPVAREMDAGVDKLTARVRADLALADAERLVGHGVRVPFTGARDPFGAGGSCRAGPVRRRLLRQREGHIREG